jgi:hypothetical protein
MIPRRKSWADRAGIPTGSWGEIANNIPIREENRATVWEFRKEGIEILMKIAREQYTKKGIHCTLFGIDEGNDIKYAVFVRPRFLTEVTEDE